MAEGHPGTYAEQPGGASLELGRGKLWNRGSNLGVIIRGVTENRSVALQSEKDSDPGDPKLRS